MAGVLTAETAQGAANVAHAAPVTTAKPGREASRWLSDDEILGLGDRTRSKGPTDDGASEFGEDAPGVLDEVLEASAGQDADDTPTSEDDAYREVFDANPELKRAWDEAQAYREAFATPEEARTATKMIADVRTMDALFFSKRAEDHAELAKMVAKLDPEAFASLAKAMSAMAADGNADERAENRAARVESDAARQVTGVTSAGEQFVQAANAEAVRSVIQAIGSQVERVLPQDAPRAARERVVGEIYRELDKTLQTNPDFVKHVRSAMRSGKFDARHQSAVVSLIVGRARQTLPSVAKRVLNEWTSTILAANQDRRAKQRSAESRVDIAGTRGGADAKKARSPRDIDYKRMSDADILNL